MCPSDGLYFLNSFFYHFDSLNVDEPYQFQMRVGEVILGIYGGTDSWDGTMTTMNILVPIVSNQDGLCLRCYPFESKKWYLASMKSDITNTVETYICGEYTYAHI